jgi:hypothetical protein
MSAPRYQPTADVEVRITLNLYYVDALRINRDGELLASAEKEAAAAMLAHVREIEKLANKLGLSVEDNDDGVQIDLI